LRRKGSKFQVAKQQGSLLAGSAAAIPTVLKPVTPLHRLALWSHHLRTFNSKVFNQLLNETSEWVLVFTYGLHRITKHLGKTNANAHVATYLSSSCDQQCRSNKRYAIQLVPTFVPLSFLLNVVQGFGYTPWTISTFRLSVSGPTRPLSSFVASIIRVTPLNSMV
jgi:hypothetical protein